MKGARQKIAKETPTRGKILESAREVFADEGYHRASVSEIADESGVGKGTIYQYFENKGDLFAQIVRDISGSIAARVESSIERVESPRRKLEIILEAHLEMFESNRSVVEILVNEGLEPTGLRENDVVEQWNSYLQIVEAVFRAGVRDGTFSCENPDTAAQVFVSSVWGLLRSAVIFGRREIVDDCSGEFMQIFLEGVLEENNGQEN